MCLSTRPRAGHLNQRHRMTTVEGRYPQNGLRGKLAAVQKSTDSEAHVRFMEPQPPGEEK